MASQLVIELEILQPIELNLLVDPGYQIVPSHIPGAEPLFISSEAFQFQLGDKAKLDEMYYIQNLELLFENNLI